MSEEPIPIAGVGSSFYLCKKLDIMIALSKEIIRKVKDGFLRKEDLVHYLMRNFNLYEITESLAECILEIETNEVKPIVVTEEEFNQITSLFRIRGFDVNGKPNPQGRKRKDSPM